MAFVPNSNIILLQTPLESDYMNTLDFENEEEQYNYFISKKVQTFSFEDFTYIRKDNQILVPVHIDKLWNCNYLMYQNSYFTNKWFYCFILKMEYVNDNCTRLFIATDVFQTWMFNYEIKQSFVEREMIDVDKDVPGANLIPEGLETGEFKVDGTANFDDLQPVAVIAYSRNPKEDGLTEQTPPGQGVIANGIPNGMYFWFVSFSLLQGALQSISGAAHSDAIVTVFTVPAFCLIGFNGWTLQDILSGVSYWLVSDFKANPVQKTLVSTPNNLDGYVPRNQKLRTYPYMYLGFNPTNGSQKIYRYENFENGTPVFNIYSEINQNPSICFIPQNYRGANGNSMSDMATMQGYPTIGWITDYFNTWLAQNSEIVSLNMQQEQFNYEVNSAKTGLEGTSKILQQAFTGNLGALTTGAELGLNLASQDVNHEYYIKQQLAQIEKQQMLPNQATMSGSNATLLGYGLMDNNIFTRYTIKSQFAERIDKYFDMYGYLTNTVKIPNLKNRPNWNYVKTINIDIITGIPQEDVEILKNIFNTGVTIWHNPDTFGDYSQNNR